MVIFEHIHFSHDKILLKISIKFITILACFFLISFRLFVIMYFLCRNSEEGRGRGRSETIGMRGQRDNFSPFMRAACDETKLCDISSCQTK